MFKLAWFSREEIKDLLLGKVLESTGEGTCGYSRIQKHLRTKGNRVFLVTRTIMWVKKYWNGENFYHFSPFGEDVEELTEIEIQNENVIIHGNWDLFRVLFPEQVEKYDDYLEEKDLFYFEFEVLGKSRGEDSLIGNLTVWLYSDEYDPEPFEESMEVTL